MGSEHLNQELERLSREEILMSEMPNPMFVAEISANHLGNFERAKKLVFAAINSGATAVKFQKL